MTFNWREYLGAGILGAAAAMPTWAATDFPTKPVTLIVPSAPGSGPDNVARPLADRLSQIWGKPVVVENRPGASYGIGAAAVAKAAPDGHTLLYTISGPIVVNPLTMANLQYDAEKDFVPVARVVRRPLILVSGAQLPPRSLQEFLVYARDHSLAYASWGNGSSAHLAGETIKKTAGIDMLHVPYKGSSMNDLVGGQIAAAFTEPSGAKVYIDSGKAVGLAVAGPTRARILPDVPTFREAGMPEIEPFYGWHGVFAPAGTPPQVVNTLSDAFMQAVKTPEFSKFLVDQGGEPDPMSAQEFSSALDEERVRWKRIVQSVGQLATD